METTRAAQGRVRFEGVDSLRAIAALAVLLYHVALASGYSATWGGLAFRLNTGVAVFFAISGFVLYRPFVVARLEHRPAPDLRVYFVRRFTRIVPAYWLALTVLALWPGLPGIFSGHAWVYFGFLQIYHPFGYHAALIPAWSLCVEVTFYLALPAFAAWTARLARAGQRRADVLGLGLLLIAPMLWRGTYMLMGHHHGNLFVSLPFYLDWFVPGMALAAVSARSHRPLTPSWALTSWAAAGVVFLLIWRVAGWRLSSLFEAEFNAGLYALLGFFLLAPAALRTERGFVSKVLSRRELIWLGAISYGIYLWHYPLAFAFHAHGLGLAGTLIATLAASVALASASYYVLERPLMRRTRVYAERRSATTSAARLTPETQRSLTAVPPPVGKRA